MIHEKLTHEIIGAAMTVLNELKPGLDEKLYENALILELATRGHLAEQQREHPVFYRSHLPSASSAVKRLMDEVRAETEVTDG